MNIELVKELLTALMFPICRSGVNINDLRMVLVDLANHKEFWSAIYQAIQIPDETISKIGKSINDGTLQDKLSTETLTHLKN